jgi:sugar phosphate isomerase/epimerase
MHHLRISITLETLGLPLRTAVGVAVKAGCEGLVFDATGTLSPAQLSDTGRREIRQLVSSHRLQLVALRCPLRRGLDELDSLDARLERLKQALMLANDLGPRLVLIGIGPIPEKEDDPVRQRMKSALGDLVRYADQIGSRIALDAGFEPPQVLLGLLRSFDTGSLGVSVDPAVFLMEKLPPEGTLRALAGSVWHSYARDAVQRRLDRSGREVPLGQGDIDWLSWLASLEEIGYAGWLTIRQGAFTQPSLQAQAAVQFLHRLGIKKS